MAALRWLSNSFGLFLLGALAGGMGELRAAEFPGTLVLGRPTDTLMAANLMPSNALSAYLEHGTAPGAYDRRSETLEFTAGQPRELELRNLAPNTRHYYRIRFRPAGAADYDASPEYSFMTARPPGSTFVFGVQGDSHPERTRIMFDAALYTRTMQLVAADRPDFYFLLGDDFSVDTINQANPRAVTQPQVVERYRIQRPYLGIPGRGAAMVLVNGNHEQAARYLLDGTPDNVAVWAQNARNSHYPQPAPDAFYSGNPEVVPHIGLLRNHFAWTWGDALFVAIDPYWGSPVVVDGDFYGGPKTADGWLITHGDAQYRWLKETLEGSRAKYKFVFAHHVLGTGRGGIDVASRFEWGGLNNNGTPGFAARRPGWAMPIHQLMAANKVTIFFQSHDHIFVRQQLDGVVYQSLGNPADPNYSLFNTDAYATGDRFPNSGYARVTVSPTGVKVEYIRSFLPADEGPGKQHGAVAYSYTIGALEPATPAPVITQQPQSRRVAAGGPATFSVSATSSLPLSYQWQRNGIDLPGASTSQLSLPRVQAADAGAYTVVVRTSAGAVTSAVANLTLGSSRLVNLSVRSTAATGDDSLIVGFVAGPGAGLPVLVRGVGPTLGAFGVTGALADPVLTVTGAGGAALAANDDWGRAANASELAAAAAQAGAFALPTASLDAAVLAQLSPGAYTATVAGKTAAAGVALVEAYERGGAAGASRLVNVSARARVSGGDALLAGFVISGDVPKQVLIRGVGPTLAGFGVGGALADPQLTVRRQGSTTALETNDNWLSAPNAAQIGLAAGTVGAFPLPANSRDAAVLIALEPGAYTAQVSGPNANASGVALVEIYEVP